MARRRSVIVLEDLGKTILILLMAYGLNQMLMQCYVEGNNAELVFVLAVVLISMLTSGYVYGIAASVISPFCINYFFMYPYEKFTLLFRGYPIAFLSMLVIAVAVCTMTSRIKIQAEEANERELRTRELYEQNQRLTEERTEAYLEAEKEKMRGNLLRAVSHDLRTPLTAILGASSVILENGESEGWEEIRRLASDMKEDAEWLINMVENLLSVTRMNASGDAALEIHPEAAEEVMGDAVLKIRKRYPSCTVNVSLPEEVLMVSMDPMLIKQVLINLLENAVRHSGSEKKIQLSVKRERRLDLAADEVDPAVECEMDYAIFEVRDQGKGLTESELAAVLGGRTFDPDGSADSSRGSGIGLSVCQSIVKAHGGIFEAENGWFGGAVFRFGLPMQKEDNINEFKADDSGR